MGMKLAQYVQEVVRVTDKKVRLTDTGGSAVIEWQTDMSEVFFVCAECGRLERDEHKIFRL